MRNIDSSVIEMTVKKLCLEANTVLRKDVFEALRDLYEKETDPRSKDMLKVLIENATIADDEKLAICQDTGMVAVFMDIGRDVSIKGGSVAGAVNRGVADAYNEGYFRNSVVADPLKRENTGDNTPAVIHTEIVEGDGIKVSVMPKGFGAENKSRIKMLNPTSGTEEIVDFCVETIKEAGPDGCPPYVLGIGMGGTLERCAFLAKKALLRPVGSSNPKPHIAELEREIKKRTDELKIGVMGLGGNVTVLGVNILESPTHIAGLPVAVNVCCHALRSATGEI